MSDGKIFSALNYLVPSTGSTHAYDITQDFTTPLEISWDLVSLDAQQFVPSGVFVDNRLGTTDIVITVNEIGFTVACPPGAQIARPYPAPLKQTVTIEGGGNDGCVVVFVDFPVIPYTLEGTGGTSSVLVIPGYDTVGDQLPAGFDYLPQSFTYDGTFIDTISVTNGTNTWTQTYTNDGTNITDISGWVKS